MGPVTTPEYNEWWVKRINDNFFRPSLENNQSIEEHLRVVFFELEIIKQDFERRNAKLEKKIEQIEEEKMNLRLDVDVQKLEAEKLRNGKNKAEDDLDSLKTDYKKLDLSMRTAGLGKTSEQWREEIREERNKNQNSAKELKASLSKIEEMKNKIKELETTLRNCRVRIEYLEANEGRQNEQHHYFQNQVSYGRSCGSDSSGSKSPANFGSTVNLKVNLEANQPTKHRYVTRAKSKNMDQRLERLEQFQKEMQDQLQQQMQERLEKIQQDMMDRMIESQGNMMTQLTQLLARGNDKGKGPYG
ncbi:hypothetical protein Goklo_016408 [Gossypium klotzschianum]|uniref:Uncharacterized protein n=1 Tax=Gossypium klotzschianum TaxID=34286 RepID=A0A7J8UEP6_9ROSI|nr:hypothetical protein [Gossypium klotzschianum]